MNFSISPELQKELSTMSQKSKALFENMTEQPSYTWDDLTMIYLAGWIRGERDTKEAEADGSK